ncbi:alpha/beta hydrolase [Mesorhizobium sp. WSM2239]|uniref:Alpha/beta hydrolase n=2 Tax=unclassified Mesorhizobium TaxID=325217 RepID=A0AAU8DGW9_9HYPH
MNVISAGMAQLSAEMAALIALVAAESGPQPDPTLMAPADGRAVSEEINRRWNKNLPPVAKEADVWVEANAQLGSSRCRMRVLGPRDHAAGAILFVHGGGFAFCSPETHERCARVLAIEVGMPVLVPDYRLAPEQPYPAGLMDVIGCMRAAFAATESAGIQRGPLLVAGDSAGANLALAATLHEQAAGLFSVAGALLFYGTYARNFATPSYRDFADGPGLTRGKMERYWGWYAGGKDVAGDPLACPLAASDDALATLPPLHLLAAAVDPLLSDTLILHERLAALGRKETVAVVPGVTHGFLQNTMDLAAAREALSTAAKDARRMAASQ